MNKISYILVSIFFVGCASTTSELRTKYYIYETESTRKGIELVKCISQRLAFWGMPTNPTVIETSSGFSIQRIDRNQFYAEAVFAIDVDLKISGSTIIKIYSSLPFTAGNKMLKDSISECI